MSDYAIKLEKVYKSFEKNKQSIMNKIRHTNNKSTSKFYAIKDLSIEINKGETVAVIGLNGSGKSTLLKLIAGIYQPDSGSIDVNGKIGPLLQMGPGFQKELPAKDNILIAGLLLGLSKSEITSKMDSILEYAGLKNFSNMKIMHYSSGMRVRLAFATALQVNPDILLVDEALAVGDKLFKAKSNESFKEFKKRGKTILFTTHSMRSVQDIADSVLLMNEGELIHLGDPIKGLELYEKMTSKKMKEK